MLSLEMFRSIADEREREVQAQICLQRLLEPRRAAIRWHHRDAKPAPRDVAADRAR